MRHSSSLKVLIAALFPAAAIHMALSAASWNSGFFHDDASPH
jgi:hypothetical protein